MKCNTPSAVTPQLVIGLFVMLLGVVLTLDRLELVAARHLQLFWPLVLTAIGTALLMRRQDSRGRFWGIFWTGLGGWLLLDALGVIQVSPGDLIVPLVFILLGGTLIAHTIRAQREGPTRPERPLRPSPRAGWPPEPASHSAGVTVPPPLPRSAGLPQSDGSGRISLFAVMGEAKRASNDDPLRGGEMTAIMGGCVLDLRQATIPPGGRATINVFALMAGHEIWVPPGWVVLPDMIPVMGGTDDKRLPPLEPLPPDAPRLVLKGLVLMGGVVIKN